MQWACHNSHPRPGPTVVESQPLVTLSHTVARSLALSPLWGLLALCVQACVRLPQFRVNTNDAFLFCPPL